MKRALSLRTDVDRADRTNRLTFIGNATLLLHLNGITLLTDPNFLHAGDHAHLGYGLTSRRLTNPAIEFDALPPYDAVLLSHYHGDHFDQIVERKLDRMTPIVTNDHAAQTLARKGFRAVTPLQCWDSVVLQAATATLDITALPGRHGPPLVAAALPAVMGSMIDVPRANGSRLRLYISGDTMIFDALREIPQRFADIDVALLHLGGTRVLGVLVTLDGKGGVAALRILEPRLAIPIHYEEYTVFRSPLADFTAAAERAGYADRIRVVGRGETYALP